MADASAGIVRPAIDYTNKDFASLRQAMLDLAVYRVPEWTDHSPADLGVLLVDLFAYMGDIILYYQDRIASESFLHTASERRSVLHLLRLIGYELKPPVPATATLTLTFDPPAQGQPTTVKIPSGARFATKPQGSTPAIAFEYLGPDLTVDLTKSTTYAGLAVQQSVGVQNEILGSSTGEPNQQFKVSQKPLIAESLEVEVDEGSGFTKWNRRDNLLYLVGADGRITTAGPDSTDYFVEFNEQGDAFVVFGDGTYGKRPAVGANNIRARYRVGGGAMGNVPPNAIVDPKTQTAPLKSVTNPQAAVGGGDEETLEHAVRFGPLAFRSGQRAVTLSDYISLAHQAGGVAKVRAVSRGWNSIDLYVAPEGDVLAPAPANLKQRLVAYFQDKRMVGTFVFIKDPVPAPLEIRLSVIAAHNHDPAQVRQAAEKAVRDLLAYKNVDFAKTLYLSKIYETVDVVPGVDAVNVKRFQRAAAPPLPVIPPEGRIVLSEFEIPVLQNLIVELEGVAP